MVQDAIRQYIDPIQHIASILPVVYTLNTVNLISKFHLCLQSVLLTSSNMLTVKYRTHSVEQQSL